MDKYRCLLKVIEYGSFAEAAKALNYTQPAVSHTINTLETELQFRIFMRSRHGLQLTYEGAQLLPYIRELVKAEDALFGESLALRNSRSGMIKVATFGTFVNKIFPQVLRTFQVNYPNVFFEFHQGYYREIESWVNKDAVDFGITSLDNISANLNDNITRISLFYDDFYLAVPKAHPLSSCQFFDIRSLTSCKSIDALVTLDEGEDRTMLSRLSQMKGKSAPKIKYQFCDYDTILKTVEFGLGAAIVPRLAFNNGRPWNLSFIPIAPSENRKIGIIYKTSNFDSFSSYTKDFIQYLEEQVRNIFEGDPS